MKEIKREEKTRVALEKAKTAKLIEIQAEKDTRKLLPVEVNGKFFNGGRLAAQKYNEAFELAELFGMEHGIFITADGGEVIVDKAYAVAVVKAIAAPAYNYAIQQGRYEKAIELATTIAEVEAIQWDEADYARP